MKKLIENQTLTLEYKQGFGSWTYHLVIPNTKDIQGKWGYMKVFGLIDDYYISELNLAPRKGEDKIISINNKIRTSINKDAGDNVVVSLYLREFWDEEDEIMSVINKLKKDLYKERKKNEQEY